MCPSKLHLCFYLPALCFERGRGNKVLRLFYAQDAPPLILAGFSGKKELEKMVYDFCCLKEQTHVSGQQWEGCFLLPVPW